MFNFQSQYNLFEHNNATIFNQVSSSNLPLNHIYFPHASYCCWDLISCYFLIEIIIFFLWVKACMLTHHIVFMTLLNWMHILEYKMARHVVKKGHPKYTCYHKIERSMYVCMYMCVKYMFGYGIYREFDNTIIQI